MSWITSSTNSEYILSSSVSLAGVTVHCGCDTRFKKYRTLAATIEMFDRISDEIVYRCFPYHSGALSFRCTNPPYTAVPVPPISLNGFAGGSPSPGVLMPRFRRLTVALPSRTLSTILTCPLTSIYLTPTTLKPATDINLSFLSAGQKHITNPSPRFGDFAPSGCFLIIIFSVALFAATGWLSSFTNLPSNFAGRVDGSDITISGVHTKPSSYIARYVFSNLRATIHQA